MDSLYRNLCASVALHAQSATPLRGLTGLKKQAERLGYNNLVPVIDQAIAQAQRDPASESPVFSAAVAGIVHWFNAQGRRVLGDETYLEIWNRAEPHRWELVEVWLRQGANWSVSVPSDPPCQDTCPRHLPLLAPDGDAYECIPA